MQDINYNDETIIRGDTVLFTMAALYALPTRGLHRAQLADLPCTIKSVSLQETTGRSICSLMSFVLYRTRMEVAASIPLSWAD